MNRDEAKQLSETAFNELANELERGRSDQLRRYLDTMAKFHRYSFGNVLLIAFQRPDATHVAGFRTWRKLGRWVRKGEHGIMILAPVVYHAKKGVDQPNSEPETQVHRLAGFKPASVFDVSQTEGKELPEFAHVQGDVSSSIGKLKAAITGHGITLLYETLPHGVLGAYSEDQIFVQPDMEPAQTFAVLVHEFAHALLHRNQRDASKKVRETEAEATAYVVCRSMGLDTSTASSDYIQLYHGTKDTLMASLQAIQETAAGIILQLQTADD